MGIKAFCIFIYGVIGTITVMVTMVTILPLLAIIIYLLGGVMRILNWLFKWVEDSIR